MATPTRTDGKRERKCSREKLSFQKNIPDFFQKSQDGKIGS